LRAEGERQSAILRAEGQAEAIGTVFKAIHEGDPDPKVLAYQYLQMLPQLANGQGNTFWVIPSEVTTALKSLSSAFDPSSGSGSGSGGGQGSSLASAAAGIASAAGLPELPTRPAQILNGGHETNSPAAVHDAAASAVSPLPPAAPPELPPLPPDLGG
jgi:hypothetical protein